MNFEEEKAWLAKGAGSLSDEDHALLCRAKSLQAQNPHEAWQVAQGIKYNRLRESQLRNIAVEVARTDADQAEDLARRIVSIEFRGSALDNIAVLMANTDPSRTERLQDEVRSMYRKGSS